MVKQKRLSRVSGHASFLNTALGNERPPLEREKNRQILAKYSPKRTVWSREKTRNRKRKLYADLFIDRMKIAYPRELSNLLMLFAEESRLFKLNSIVTSFQSGLGLNESFIAHRFCPRGRVTGVDFSSKCVAEARKIAQKAGVENVRFLEENAEGVSISDASQDVVFATSPSDFTSKMAKEAKRILKRGGTLFLFAIKDHQANRIKRSVLKAGFKSEHEMTVVLAGHKLPVLLYRKVN